MTSYLQDKDGDLPCRLLTIGSEDNATGAINTGVANEGTTVAADNSPVSDTGTWEEISHEDAN